MKKLYGKELHKGFTSKLYPVNYGYIPNTKARDGKEIDVYVLYEFEHIESFRGRVIANIKEKMIMKINY